MEPCTRLVWLIVEPLTTSKQHKTIKQNKLTLTNEKKPIKKKKSAIRKLLHVAVSDVSDDVRRAAVIALGFLLFNEPEQVKLNNKQKKIEQQKN